MVDELQATLDRLTAELTGVREELGRTKELLAHCEGEQVRLEAMRHEATLEFTKRELEGTQERAQELKSERDEARGELGKERAENEELKNRAASISGELKEAQSEKKRLGEQLQDERKEKEEVRENSRA